MQPRIRRFSYLLPLVLLFATASSYAQFNSDVQGTVIDPKGAVVPGAAITLTNAGQGAAASGQQCKRCISF